jgi:hypothetical protein
METKIIFQNVVLAAEPSPVDNRADERRHPVEDGEIRDRVQGFSLAPRYSLKQLRAIQRRKTKTKLDSQRFKRM